MSSWRSVLLRAETILSKHKIERLRCYGRLCRTFVHKDSILISYVTLGKCCAISRKGTLNTGHFAIRLPLPLVHSISARRKGAAEGNPYILHIQSRNFMEKVCIYIYINVYFYLIGQISHCHKVWIAGVLYIHSIPPQSDVTCYVSAQLDGISVWLPQERILTDNTAYIVRTPVLPPQQCI
jgi:hypothetical protein